MVSETTIASSTAKIVMATMLARPSASALAVPIVFASPVVDEQRAEDDAGAEQQDRAPVDPGGVAPASA